MHSVERLGKTGVSSEKLKVKAKEFFGKPEIFSQTDCMESQNSKSVSTTAFSASFASLRETVFLSRKDAEDAKRNESRFSKNSKTKTESS